MGDLSKVDINGMVVQSAQTFSIFLNCNLTPSSSCWGDTVGFLNDLFASDFIHITDQYVNSNANGRYIVGTSYSLTAIEPPTMTDKDIHAAVIQSILNLFPNGGGGGTIKFIIFSYRRGKMFVSVVAFAIRPITPPPSPFVGITIASTQLMPCSSQST
jgi:hypothetical protein